VSTDGEWEIETMLEIIGACSCHRRQGCRQGRVKKSRGRVQEELSRSVPRPRSWLVPQARCCSGYRFELGPSLIHISGHVCRLVTLP
jgi:hypothetical protein